jgi:two-component system, NarL family, nitrate/nitrite response regulator NarL
MISNHFSLERKVYGEGSEMTVTSPENIRILIIDSNRLVRAGLRMLIENQPGFFVLAEADGCKEGLQFLDATPTQIILFNLDSNGGNQLDELPQLLGGSEMPRIILLTDALDPEIYGRAVSLGVRGVVGKTQNTDVLFKAIRAVHQGSIWLDRSMMANAIANLSREMKDSKPDPERPKISTLTDRELQVVSLVCLGLKNKQIATKLFISQATVRHHLTSIFNKLDLSDRLELILYAFRNRLAEPPR